MKSSTLSEFQDTSAQLIRKTITAGTNMGQSVTRSTIDTFLCSFQSLIGTKQVINEQAQIFAQYQAITDVNPRPQSMDGDILSINGVDYDVIFTKMSTNLIYHTTYF